MSTTKATEELLAKLSAGKMSPEDRQALLATLQGLEAQEAEHKRLVAVVAKLVDHFRTGGYWNEWEEKETHQALASDMLTEGEKAPLAKCLEDRDTRDQASVRRIAGLKAAVAAGLAPLREVVSHNEDWLQYATGYFSGDQTTDWIGRMVFSVLQECGVSMQDFDDHIVLTLQEWERQCCSSWRASAGGYLNAIGQTQAINPRAIENGAAEYRKRTREALEKAEKERERAHAAWMEAKKLQSEREAKIVSCSDPMFSPGEVLPREL